VFVGAFVERDIACQSGCDEDGKQCVRGEKGGSESDLVESRKWHIRFLLYYSAIRLCLMHSKLIACAAFLFHEHIFDSCVYLIPVLCYMVQAQQE
jgi:hypothetical protein